MYKDSHLFDMSVSSLLREMGSSNSRKSVPIPVRAPVPKVVKLQTVDTPKKVDKVPDKPHKVIKNIDPDSDDDVKPRRLKIIHKLLSNMVESPPEATSAPIPVPVPASAPVPMLKPKKPSAMSALWGEAKSKNIKGFNRMRKAELITALSQISPIPHPVELISPEPELSASVPVF